MKKIDLSHTYERYEDFERDYHDELLQAALDAIDPDAMGMNRDQALTLAGSMKAAGCSQQQFADIMSRSTADKGTFTKQWNKFTGKSTKQSSDCTEKSIFYFAKECGWHPPKMDEIPDFIARVGAKAPAGKKDPAKKQMQPKEELPTLVAPWTDDFKISCIIDSKEYKSKPSKVWEIRNREQSPTPEPEPISIVDFAREITGGCTFSPTVYNKVHIGTENNGKPIYRYDAIMQQVFVVDIDNEEPALDENGKRIKNKKRRIDNPIDVSQAMKICKQHGIMPFFVYETFSSKNHRDDPIEPYPKFRLCFATDKPVTVQEYGNRGRQKAINYFIGLFGKAADTSTTDPARLIYGTDERERARLMKYIIDSEKLMEVVYMPQEQEEIAEDTELPKIETLAEYSGNIPQPPEELIAGVLRVSHKMLIAGASKIGKSFLLMYLAICIAYGLQWLGFRCKKSKVLYLNLEIDHDSAIRRFAALHESMGYNNAEMPENIDLWNLRGEAVPLDQLVEPVLERAKGKNYAAIIIDPIYKVITGDENNATEMGRFCNQFDKICKGSGSAVIYCHHHSKGVQGHKSAIDRSSGSGVFARDPDAVLDICELDLKSCDRFPGQKGKPFRLDCTLREFRKPSAVNFWFDYPNFILDQTGNLAACSVTGGKQTSEEYSKQNTIQLQEAYNELAAGGHEVKIKEVAETCNVTTKTIRNWNDKAGKPFKILRGVMVPDDGFKALPDLGGFT